MKAGRFIAIIAFIYAFVPGDAPADDQKLTGQWVHSYWFRPLPPQGILPEGFDELESSLLPEDCGHCHEKQFGEWVTSRHSMAMEEGVLGQFHEPWLDKEKQISCQDCHAPLYEQYPFVFSQGKLIENRFFQEELYHQGVSCAVCHVRKQIRYGPPPAKMQDPDAPHNGFHVIEDFNRSEFCRSCHQFEPGQRSLNGKLMEDTYEQWKKSPAAKEGISCAGCHMPNREHSFKGIHSEDLTSAGVDIQLDRDIDSATLYIKNSNTGHKFPTYVTPKVRIIGRVLNPEGDLVKGTEKEFAIQWSVSLDLQKEFFDTRLDPGETMKAFFEFPKGFKEHIYEIEVKVFPDEFYTRFYEAILANPPDGVDVKMIKAAREKSLKSPYVIYNRRFKF